MRLVPSIRKRRAARKANAMQKVNPRLLILLCLGFIALMAATIGFLPSGVDWTTNYRPASLALLRGESPYSVELFFAPPWSLLPLVPFAVLPAQVGRVALFVVSILSFAFTAYRLGASPLGVAIFVLSPPVVHCLLNANIEWIPLLGFVLPPQVGLLMITAKIQTGWVVGLFLVVEAWRKGGLREVMRISWPLLAAFLVSCLLFGLWPLHLPDAMPLARDINASLWPYSIPVGLALLVASVRKRDIRLAMPASPCLSPYALFHTWSAAVVALVPSTAELAAAVAGLWIVVGIQALTP